MHCTDAVTNVAMKWNEANTQTNNSCHQLFTIILNLPELCRTGASFMLHGTVSTDRPTSDFLAKFSPKNTSQSHLRQLRFTSVYRHVIIFDSSMVYCGIMLFRAWPMTHVWISKNSKPNTLMLLGSTMSWFKNISSALSNPIDMSIFPRISLGYSL